MQKKLSVYKKEYKIGLSWKSFNNQFAENKSLNLKLIVALSFKISLLKAKSVYKNPLLFPNADSFGPL